MPDYRQLTLRNLRGMLRAHPDLFDTDHWRRMRDLPEDDLLNGVLGSRGLSTEGLTLMYNEALGAIRTGKPPEGW